MTKTMTAGNTTFEFDDQTLSTERLAVLTSAITALAASKYAEDLLGETRTIQVLNSNTGSRWVEGKIYLDTKESTAGRYIDLTGNKSALTERGVFIHELVHLATGKNDLVTIQGTPVDEINLDQYRDLLATPASDLLGETVRYTNSIMLELFDEQPRGHCNGPINIRTRSPT